MRRIALILLSILVALPALAQSMFLREIQVEGNQRVSAETVQSYMQVQIGGALGGSDLNQALKRLYDTGLFADVSFRQDGETLIVTIAENPVINQIVFEGNDAIDDETLEAEVTLEPRIVFTRSRVQSDVQRLLQLYRASGRFAAVVDPKIIQLEQNRVDLVFEITEGSPTRVSSIRFIGNRDFDDSDLKDVITTSVSKWYNFLSTTDHYDPNLVDLDREQLRQFYLNNGYVDFRVVSAVADLTPDRQNFFITFSLEEGQQYTVSAVDVVVEIGQVELDDLRDSLQQQVGELYNAGEVEESVQSIKFALGQQGFAFVDVRPETNRDREKRTVELIYRVQEGPRVYVERIDIEGNTRTIDTVIRREMRLIEGDSFDTAKLERSRRRLRAIDYFSNITITPEQGSARDRAVVKVKVEEQPTGELSLGAGYSTTETLIGDISVRERNLLGRGQDIRLGLSLSLRRREIDLSFTEPYFLGKPVAVGFDLFNTNVDFQDESSLDQKTTGLRLRSGLSLTERLRLNGNYQIRRDSVDNVSTGASELIKSQAGDTLISSIGYSLRYDRTDDPLVPKTGYAVTVEQEFAGLGGSVRDVRNQLRYAHFFSLTDRLVLQFATRGGAVFGLGKDIRLSRRFFVGGDSFRGFAASGVGPRDISTGDAVGGEFFGSGTTELTFPLGLPDEFGISGRVFSDYGTAFGVAADGGVEDDRALRLSSGIGLTWQSPFGPMLFDVSKVILKNDLDETEIFRFSFGTRF